MKTVLTAIGAFALFVVISSALLYLFIPKWYHIAAERGNTDVQVMLGMMYRDGRRVPQDEAKAAQWFQKAAENGNADAQLLLGVMYLLGRVVNRDQQAGCRLLHASAEQGRTDAIELYSDFCAAEKADVPKDELEKRLNDAMSAWSNRVQQKIDQPPPVVGLTFGRQ